MDNWKLEERQGLRQIICAIDEILAIDFVVIIIIMRNTDNISRVQKYCY